MNRSSSGSSRNSAELLNPSAYYPPRAKWYSRLWYPWFRFTRSVYLERLGLAPRVSFGQFLLSLILPGYAFVASDWKRVGLAMTAGYALVLVLFFAALGQPAGNLAFGLILSLHVTSVLRILTRCWTEPPNLKVRMALTAVTLVGLYGLLYEPFRWWVTHHLAMPLRINNQVIIIRPGLTPKDIRRGDVVAYQINGFSGPGYYVQAGFGLEPVLALPGDHVEFFDDRIEVNGTPSARRKLMPLKGAEQVLEKNWLIWPGMAINNPGNQPQLNVPGVMLRAAMVPEEQLIGKPYRSWFGRRQLRP